MSFEKNKRNEGRGMSRNKDQPKEAHKPKGILKKPEDQDSSGSKNHDDKLNQKKSIKWDEMNVIATLHPIGKAYGHMKIEEAPTPFARNVDIDEEGVDPDELAKRLEYLETEENERSTTSSNKSTESEEELPEAVGKREMFAKKRREYYTNEFKEAKRRLSQLEGVEDDDNN